MKISPNIFRNYDIRGLYPGELSEEAAKHIGKSLGTLIKKQGGSKVVVGMDDRESSPILSQALVDGLLSTGCDVVDTGITITPAIHFFTRTMDFDLGVCITASHNPKQFNGFRLDYRNAKSLYGDDIQKLKALAEKEEYVSGMGEYKKIDINEKYVDFYKNGYSFLKKFKVVIDCGSGATALIAPKIFNNLGCEVIPVYCEYDSNFPHGVPDPENTTFINELKKHVLINNADVGFSYDTDGDRFGAVDANGVGYATDRLLLLYAESVLKLHKGATVVFDVKSSALIEKTVRDLGGNPKMMRTGHPYFTDAVEGDAILGAEFSGHIYFADEYYGYDDGIYASYRLLKILDTEQKSLSEMMSKFPSRSASNELKVSCPDSQKFKVIHEVKEYIKKNVAYNEINEIDGIRVAITDSGWFLIRASNTSPYISIRVEGSDDSERDSMLLAVRKALNSVKSVKLVLSFN